MTDVIFCRSGGRRRLGALGAVACATAFLVVPAIAGAGTSQRPLPPGFVPYRSISAVRLDMSEKTVRARLGVPSSINLGSKGQGDPSQLIYSRSSPRQSLIITFDQHRKGDPVAHIQASGRSFRTTRGIGIGSSRAAVRRAFPHLRAENGSFIGQRGSAFMDIDIVHGRVVLLGLADTRLRSFAVRASSPSR
jgi:hypothetical protein